MEVADAASELLWLWCRPAAAALIPPLAWKLPHAQGHGPKNQKKKKKVMLILQGISKGVFRKVSLVTMSYFIPFHRPKKKFSNLKFLTV